MTVALSSTLAVVLSLGAAGCQRETGIVVQVTRGDAVSEPIAQLELFVGLQDEQTDASSPASYLRDQRPEDTVALDPARDLAADPFRLLLRPEDIGRAGAMTVGVLARSASGDELAAGVLPRPVEFVADTVLEFDLELAAGAASAVANPACLGVGQVLIAPADDRDCDAFPPPADCDDRDARVHPEQPERCDGVDTNCDGARFPARQLCLGVEDDACVLGEQVCDDEDPANPGPFACTPIIDGGEPPELPLCEAFSACEQAGDPEPFECALGEAGVGEVSVHACELRHHAGGPCPGAAVSLAPLAGGGVCLWTLLGGGQRGAYRVALIDSLGTQGETSTDCDTGVGVVAIEGDEPPETERVYVVGELDGERVLVRLDLAPQLVGDDEDACPADEPALRCDGLEPLAGN